jgi:D-tyrosyl-tRNA(Tyr) deacylase
MRDQGRITFVRVVVQRVTGASVSVDGRVVSSCGPGLLVLLGVAKGDTATDAERLAAKVARLRVFERADGKLDLSLLDTGGDVLIVSQFTLVADTGKGHRPSFARAAGRELAEPIVTVFCDTLRALGLAVQTGRFGARMSVTLVNDGPVTIVLG